MRYNHYDCPPECCGSFMDKQDDGTFKCFYCKSIEAQKEEDWITLITKEIPEIEE